MAVPQPVQNVNAQHPELLQTNTHETDAHFLWFSCQALGPDWRLLGKAPHENGYTWPNGVRTSHDAIFRVDAAGNKVEGRDIIMAAGNGVPTEPAWGEIPPNEWRASNLPVPISDVPAPPGSAPPHHCKLGVSFFPALGLKHHDPARYADQLGWHRTVLKPDYARVIFYLAEGPWGIVGTGHLSDAKRQDLLKAVLEDLLSTGIAPQVTVFGTAVRDATRRRQLVDQCGSVLRAYGSRLFLVDAVNEPGPIGFAGNPSQPYAEVREVTRQLADMGLNLARLSPASPNTLHGGVNGQRATDAQIAADVEALMAGLPAAVNAITPHWGRSPWEPHRPLGSFAAGKKILNDEPIGFKSSVSSITTPTEFAQVYLDSVRAGDDGKTLHGEPGVWHGYCDTTGHPEWADNNEFARWQEVPQIEAIVEALHEVRATGNYSGSGGGSGGGGGTGEEPMIPYDEAKSVEFGLACNDVYAEAQVPKDAGMISVHSSRAAWDFYVGQLPWEESKKKHVNELRGEYGLPPL